MSEPRVPGGRTRTLSLPCGETVDVQDLDMGMREYDCACGGTHAVVMDMHPLSRFVPEDLVAVLDEAIDTTTGEPFGTTHAMGIVLEEFPEQVVSADTSEDGSVGYAILWMADFDSRRLHEVVVELLVELMEHAVSHASDDSAMTEFERQMLEFDVGEFVDQYRAQREFETEHDRPV
jgi:hypothetical protein